MPFESMALFKSGAAQFCIDIVVHYVSIVVETNLGIPDVKVWWKHRGIYIIWEVCFIFIFFLSAYLFFSLADSELHSNFSADCLRIQNITTRILL